MEREEKQEGREKGLPWVDDEKVSAYHFAFSSLRTFRSQNFRAIICGNLCPDNTRSWRRKYWQPSILSCTLNDTGNGFTNTLMWSVISPLRFTLVARFTESSMRRISCISRCERSKLPIWICTCVVWNQSWLRRPCCCLPCSDGFLADSLSDAEKEEDGLLIKGIKLYRVIFIACSLSEIVCFSRFFNHLKATRGKVGPRETFSRKFRTSGNMDRKWEINVSPFPIFFSSLIEHDLFLATKTARGRKSGGKSGNRARPRFPPRSKSRVTLTYS